MNNEVTPEVVQPEPQPEPQPTEPNPAQESKPAKVKPSWSCHFTFPQQKIPNNSHSVTVQANNMGRALDLAFKQLRKTVLKGRKVSVATVGIVKSE